MAWFDKYNYSDIDPNSDMGGAGGNTPTPAKIVQSRDQLRNQAIANNPSVIPADRSYTGEPGAEALGRTIANIGDSFVNGILGVGNLINGFAANSIWSPGESFDNDPEGILSSTQAARASQSKNAEEDIAYNQRIMDANNRRISKRDFDSKVKYAKDSDDPLMQERVSQWNAMGFPTLSQIRDFGGVPSIDVFGNHGQSENPVNYQYGTPEEIAKGEGTPANESVAAAGKNKDELTGPREDTGLSDREYFNNWYGETYGQDDPNKQYSGFEDFIFNGSPEDWLKFATYADERSPGMYTEWLQSMLGDHYGYDAADAAAAAEALDFFSNSFNDYTAAHTVQDLLSGGDAARDILGTYYGADYSDLIDYLNANYAGTMVGDASDYITFGGDMSPEDYAVVQQMLATTALAGGGLSGMTEELADEFGALFPQYGESGVVTMPGIDYAALDDTYKDAGLGDLSDQVLGTIAATDFMMPAYFRAGEKAGQDGRLADVGKMAQLALMSQYGYGSQVNPYDEAAWQEMFLGGQGA